MYIKRDLIIVYFPTMSIPLDRYKVQVGQKKIINFKCKPLLYYFSEPKC